MLKGKTAFVTGSTSGIGLGIPASDAATSITGAILPIDGGRTARWPWPAAS